MKIPLVFRIFSIVLCTAVWALGQTFSSSITGLVSEPSGAGGLKFN